MLAPFLVSCSIVAIIFIVAMSKRGFLSALRAEPLLKTCIDA